VVNTSNFLQHQNGLKPKGQGTESTSLSSCQSRLSVQDKT